MAEFKPREFYYHSCEAAASARERTTLPLHYYLKRGDIIAFRRELRNGSSPFVQDQYGHNALDLVLTEIEKLLVTGICTSFPIDDLISAIKTEALLPAKFCIEDKDELYHGLYAQHERALYRSFADGNPEFVKPKHERERVLPLLHQGYPLCHQVRPPHPDTIGPDGPFKKIIMDSTERIDDREDDRYSDHRSHKKRKGHRHGGRDHDSRDYDHDSVDNLETDASKEDMNRPDGDMSPENAVMIAVADSLSRPLSNKIRLRLEKMIRKLRVYLDLLLELSSSNALLKASMDRREMEQDLINKHEAGESGGDRKAVKSGVLVDLTLPYLYVTLIRLLLEIYPCAPDGVEWRATSPTDIRVLCGMICRLELAGHYIILFLSDFASGMAKLLLTVLRPPVSNTDLFAPKHMVLQYLMHMAFVLDVPELFDIIANSSQAHKLMQNNPFDWNSTYEDLQAGPKTDVIQRYIILLQKLLDT
ncbi:hypothetical protein GNI_093480 [Gregarina niphandrodes]|uniref:Uncharacterized protein n=1 Tax=Gregarina niphandrodes TaxID=110365 RepID=A0A023B592_GRENI|nr:hypothetical protein GNI_093480 [Gregarina niphandrodes]EZG58895.1 hypothetical protein GNI_093480 [Gregarina niphandrodes]|eukprot:XP_011130926.1 hypothetical protein GNI_093480 [Gregarina niphandrodes]